MHLYQTERMPSSAAYFFPIMIKRKNTLLSPVQRMNNIIGIVSKYYDIPQYLIFSKLRKREVVTARHACVYFIKQRTGYSLKRIGNHLGKLDHTTARNSIIVIKNLMDTDEIIRNDIRNINNLI